MQEQLLQIAEENKNGSAEEMMASSVLFCLLGAMAQGSQALTKLFLVCNDQAQNNMNQLLAARN